MTELPGPGDRIFLLDVGEAGCPWVRDDGISQAGGPLVGHEEGVRGGGLSAKGSNGRNGPKPFGGW